jgi:hypothetical protein
MSREEVTYRLQDSSGSHEDIRDITEVSLTVVD